MLAGLDVGMRDENVTVIVSVRNNGKHEPCQIAILIAKSFGKSQPLTLNLVRTAIFIYCSKTPASWPMWLTSKLACQALNCFDCAKLFKAIAPDRIMVTNF